jgi:ABC-type multidrug transport system fused ATPase/permease subunit
MSVIPLNYVTRALRYVLPHKRLAVNSAILSLLTIVVSLALPWPLAVVIDNALGDKPLPFWAAPFAGSLAGSAGGLILFAVLASLALQLINSALHIAAEFVNTKIDQHITLDLRSQVFLHAQKMSLAFHDQRRSGMLVYMINSQGDAAAGLVRTVPMLAESALTLFGMFWICSKLDPVLALVSLSVVPFLYLSVGYYSTKIQDRLARVRGLESDSLSIIHEAFAMMRVIVAFGREDHEFKRFRNQTVLAVNERVKITVRQTIFSLVVNFTTAIGTAIVLGLGAQHVLEAKRLHYPPGSLTVGELMVILAYLAQFYKPLEQISFTIGSLQDRFVNLRALFTLLDTQPDIADAPGAKEISRARGGVKFERVNFSYAGRTDTLKNISFEASPGQVIGIVGPTGAGKSTLVSLIPRYYDPKHGDGRILIDGVDSHDLTLKSLRAQISIVLQEPLLFSGSIKENIRYGRLEATDDEVIAAAKAANAHDFIERLPQKYDTQLGERGAQISGGERQRISVARAFLKDAPILILDEPTSSVDSKTEAVILEALERLMVGRTTFMIAHRLSTLKHADQVLVINHGELVEHGTQAELITANGLYKQLYDAQIAAVRQSKLATATAQSV